MLSEYLPILMFIGVSTVLGIVLITAGSVLSPSNPNPEKASPYECGFEAFEDTRGRFDVRFYLVAILFIIFDLEIAFFIPWAVSLDTIGMTGFIAMSFFVGLLIVGFFVEWRRGALEWE
ncbi:MAG: NADH-quinone oxidoreductase subunit A [Pseudomonadota bacterium]